MSRAQKHAVLVGGIFLMMAASPASAAAILCGIADGSPGDLDPTSGQVAGSCGSPTGLFAGLLKENNRFNYDQMSLSGTLTGSGSLSFSNAYNIGPWIGRGREWSIIGGDLSSTISTAAGTVTLTAFASTFANNSAVANASVEAAFPELLLAADFRRGRFSGPGALLGTLTWNVSTGSAIRLDSGIVGVSVPEPSSWALMISGFFATGAMFRRKGGRQTEALRA